MFFNSKQLKIFKGVKERVWYQQNNLRMLGAVFRRGIGAYRTNPGSVRPSVTSEEQWAYARVNAFLYAVRTGRFRGGKFDLDLLPSGHPLKTWA